MSDGTLSNGLTLLGMGMGFVLSFLIILIFAMFVMSKVVGFLNKVFPEAVEEVKTVAKKIVNIIFFTIIFYSFFSIKSIGDFWKK